MAESHVTQHLFRQMLGRIVGTACYVGNWERVRDFHKHLHELMAQYYPVPFPKN
jgi:hypothetical protein